MIKLHGGGTWEQDGGALMNQCIHGIDLLRWMMGDEIEEIYGATRQQFHDYLEAEDVGMAVVKFKKWRNWYDKRVPQMYTLKI